MSDELCQATACHCDHLESAEYLVMLRDGKEQRMSKCCAEMHLMAGYSSRKIPHPGDWWYEKGGN